MLQVGRSSGEKKCCTSGHANQGNEGSTSQCWERGCDTSKSLYVDASKDSYFYTSKGLYLDTSKSLYVNASKDYHFDTSKGLYLDTSKGDYFYTSEDHYFDASKSLYFDTSKDYFYTSENPSTFRSASYKRGTSCRGWWRNLWGDWRVLLVGRRDQDCCRERHSVDCSWNRKIWMYVNLFTD